MTSSVSVPKQSPAPVPKKAWPIFAVTYLASITAPLAQFKVPPLASYLIPAYGLDGVTFGYLMSALAIIGVILAFPAAFIVNKWGLKATVLVSIGCCAMGTLISAASTSLALLYFSRLIEGVGIGLIGVAAPTCVSIWFPDHKRGLALGLWGTWVPISIIFAFNTFPTFAQMGGGFQSVFYGLLVFDIIAFVLFALVFTMPKGQEDAGKINATLKESMGFVKNSKLWLLGLLFFIFNVCQLGVINSFYNTFLEEIGYSTAAASSLTSVQTVVSFFLMPVAGFVFDKTPASKKYLLMIGFFVLYIIGMAVAFQTGSAQSMCMWIFIIICGVAGAFAGGTCRPLAPTLVPNSAAATTMAMAVVQFCMNLASVIGSPLFGYTYQSLGWQAGSNILLMPLFVIAIIVSFVVFKPRED